MLLFFVGAAAVVAGCWFDAAPAQAQDRLSASARRYQLLQGRRRDEKSPMLVQATEIHYDYSNKRVSAVGNVQIYYNGTTVEADRVIYDETTKRLQAEGNVRLTEPDGKITYAEMMDLSDDFRDGFVDSLRLDTPRQDPDGGGARRPLQRQLHRLPQRRLHRLRALQGRSQEAAAVAGQGRADDPRRRREDDVLRGRAPRILRPARSPTCRTSRRPIRPSSASPAS